MAQVSFGSKFNPDELSDIHESREIEKFEKKYGSVEELAKGLQTNTATGLALEEATAGFPARRKTFGANTLPPPPIKTLSELIIAGLQDTTLVMLMIAAVVSLILGVWEDPAHGWIEGTAILIAVVLVVSVTSASDYQKEQQFRKLNEKKDNKTVRVIRGGKNLEVSIHDINVGEVVALSQGDILCADGLLIEGFNIQCDNSIATGESLEVKVTKANPFLLSGCKVSEGVGKMLVTAVGENSTYGRLFLKLQTPSEDTPLQKKLSYLANEQIAVFGLIAAGVILVALTIKLLVLTYVNGESFTWHIITEIVGYFITSVTIVVVAVPEGLPLAVTIALGYSMTQMLQDQNLVRRLDACETMGGATTICSDKTGTLTKNLMTVMKGWVGGKYYDQVSDVKGLASDLEEALHEGINLNSSCRFKISDAGKVEFEGNKTESALCNFSLILGGDYENIASRYKIAESFPFSSTIKSMSTLVEHKAGFRLFAKGASEIMLTRCKNYLSTEGEKIEISEESRKELEEIIYRMASEGLRTITLAYADYTHEDRKEINWTKNPPLTGYTLVGIVGIKDPLRDDVPDAVQKCQKAGIIVRMVTGDNIVTAKKIAQECGILTSDGIAIEGPEFRKKTASEMDEIIPKLQVMARSSPTDKHLLVQRLKYLGETVAVTGDGTNDAPALKEADVGFSMGIAGTDIAKEASAIILMDDNFSSIVKAVLWGRNVYDSIRKFLQFQLTVNVVAVTLAFIGALTDAHGQSPLKPVQLLWVNLIMDTMGALALATEPPADNLLDRKPYRKDESLISRSMWANIIGQSIFQLIVNLTVLYLGPAIFGVIPDSTEHKTLIFNIFVLCQIFNEVNCRKLGSDNRVFEGLLENKICSSILLFTFIMQFLIVEFGGEFAGTTGLSIAQWIVCIAVGALSIPVMYAIRSVQISEPVVQAPTFVRRPSALSREQSKHLWGKVRQATVQLGVIKTMQQKQPKTLIDSLRRRRENPQL
eukprot:TRINITY_DN9939_c0_g1_i1.p1 TRINITY_DN9939_c0_g1~~TRINITY_DN9939_c0_g1_i1.p1  ORF type:complete len:1009 (-),score=162.76 TRINITY_DN9939_c0_g1_i1:73-3042(-)